MITFTLGTGSEMVGTIIVETETHVTVRTPADAIFRIHRNWIIR